MQLNIINYFLPIILIFSSLKIFGYILGFLFFFPFVIKRRKKIIDHLNELPLKNKLVLYYFYFQIFQTFIGALVIRDPRIFVYWVPFYIVCIFIYYINKINLITDKFYRLNIFSILYNSSLLYFLFYLLLNIFSYIKFGNSYEIQDYFWAGSSAAFNISSILFFSIFQLWDKINYKLNSKYTYSILLYIWLININDTRLGVLYLSCFILFLIFRLIKLRKFITAIVIISLLIPSYQIASYYTGFLDSYFHVRKTKLYDPKVHDYFSHGSASIFKKLNQSTIDFFKENKQVFSEENTQKLTPDTTRTLSLLIAKEKFIQSNIYVKLFGSGWYTSRVTISDVNDQFAEKYKDRFVNCPNCIPRNKINQLQGGVAILLDTGLLGICFTAILYLLNLKNIILLKSDSILKSFYISLLFIHFLCLFIGYPLNNIIYVLCLVPGGLFNIEE